MLFSRLQRDPEERPWWEVLSFDCLFRPMASLSREVQLEEGMELLIERLATPNLWLQPSVFINDYIKDLPLWRYRSSCISEAEAIVGLMDGDNYCKYDSASSSEEGREEDCPVKGQLLSSTCAVCLEAYHSNSILCGLPCGHNYHKRCIYAWLHRDNYHCPICRWPVYKLNHPRFQETLPQ